MARAKTKRDARAVASPVGKAPALTPVLTPLLTPRRTAIALAVLFLIGIFLRLQHLNDMASRTPDETTYTVHSRYVLEAGLGAFPIMVAEYNKDERLALYPSPIRAGWDVLLAGAMSLTGVTDEHAGSWLSCFLTVVTLGLFGWLGYRFFPPWAALYGMLFLAFSVPDLTIARRCWQDSLMGTLGLLLVWAACEILRDPEKRWPYVMFVAAGSYSVLVKELGAFVYGAAVLFVMIFLLRRKAWRTIGALAAGGLAGAGLSVYLLTKVAGGLTPLLTVWQHLNAATYTNPYCVIYQGGPWYLSIAGLWILSPINLLLWVLATGVSLTPASRLSLSLSPLQLSCFRLISWMAAGVLATILILPNSQSFRFLAPVYGPMYLMGGMGAWALFHLIRPKLDDATAKVAAGILIALVLYGAFVQYEQFVRVYVRAGIPDLSIKYVLDSN